jgi:serine/threonine-protein kinase SRPK3
MPGFGLQCCSHTEYCDSADRWVAIKITIADRSTQRQELSNLYTTEQKADGNPETKYFTRILDEFVHEGPNGSHLCLVSELLGPTVNIIARDYIDVGEQLEPRTLLRISRQLIQGIAFLHDAGFAHGGKCIYISKFLSLGF